MFTNNNMGGDEEEGWRELPPSLALSRVWTFQSCKSLISPKIESKRAKSENIKIESQLK